MLAELRPSKIYANKIAITTSHLKIVKIEKIVFKGQLLVIIISYLHIADRVGQYAFFVLGF